MAWSRTSQPWQYGQWRRSRPHRSRTPGMSGSASVAPVVTRIRRAGNVRPSAKWTANPGSIDRDQHSVAVDTELKPQAASILSPEFAERLAAAKRR